MATTVPFFSFDDPTDEQLLTAALNGQPGAWPRLIRQFQSYLTIVVRRRAWGLPTDEQDEVIAEVWTAVFLRGAAAYEPEVTLARDYIASFVKDATDRVRAAYRAPGERSRNRDSRRPRKRRDPRGDHPASVVVSLDQIPEQQQPQAPSEWEEVDRNIEIDRAQALAGQDVALAIDLIRHWDIGFEEAALMVGLTRATLLRRLSQLGQRLNAA